MKSYRSRGIAFPLFTPHHGIGARERREIESLASYVQKSEKKKKKGGKRVVFRRQRPCGVTMAMEGSQVQGNAGQHRRHRRTKAPVKDTLTVMIPMDVTVDLGVAMRRTRTKRLRRLRELYPELSASAGRGRGGAGTGTEGEKGGSDEKKAAGGGVSSGAEGENDDEDDLDEDNEEGGASDGPSSGTGLRREDYGSVLDYLEAKYVRGVQIGATGPTTGDGEGGEEAAADLSDDDSGGVRSVYSDDSGIDDSMLRHEVYEQVMATGKYGGATKVEQEAKKAKKGRMESAKNSDDGGSGANDIPSTEGGGGIVDDDAFFVNVGDLEMADEGDYDGVNNIDWNAVAKAEQSSKSKKKTKKKKKATSETKKKDASSGGSKPSSRDESKGDAPKKRAKKSSEKSPKKKKDSGSAASSSSKKEKTKSPKKGGASTSKSKDGASPELSARAIELSAESAKLKAASGKLHRACVRRIKKCTEQDLPRKQKAQKKARVSVPIPTDKGPGDVVVFKNPHIPEQKLRLTVPKNWNRTKSGGNIAVNVQKSVVTDEAKENDLPKLLKDALNEYSQAFDDWVEAEGEYHCIEIVRDLDLAIHLTHLFFPSFFL